VEIINSGLESGKIYQSDSPSAILMFTQPKIDGKKARFLLDAVGRNKAVRDTIIEIPNTRMILDCIVKFKF